jgi:hypothetical protein
MLGAAGAGAVLEDAVAAAHAVGTADAIDAAAEKAAGVLAGIGQQIKESLDGEFPRLRGMGVGGLESLEALLRNALA